MAEGVLAKSKARGCDCVLVESWWSQRFKSSSLGLQPVRYALLVPGYPSSEHLPKQDTYSRIQIHSFAWKKKRSSPCLFFPQHFPISRRPLPGTTFYSFVIISHRTKTMLCLASQTGGFVLPLLKQSYWLSFWPLSLGHPTGIPGDNFFLICYLCFVILFSEK